MGIATVWKNHFSLGEGLYSEVEASQACLE